jgi:hypothetical protein
MVACVIAFLHAAPQVVSRAAWALLLTSAIVLGASDLSAESTDPSMARLPPVWSTVPPVAPVARSLSGNDDPLLEEFDKPVDFVPASGACDEILVPKYRLLDPLSVFMGLDGSKQPQDFGINAQFGGRAAVNWAVPLIESLGIGAQIGTAIDATGDAVQVQQRILGSTGRTQSYTTVGVFQRTEMGLFWGLAYDFLREDYYDNFSLGQWRFNVGYMISPRSTIGVWSTISAQSDSGTFGATPVTLVPISQTNAYYKYVWPNAVQTTFWGGLANEHGQVNAVLGDLRELHNTFVFGAELQIPLTDRLAIFGQANFITPASSGTVDSYLGFVYFPHGGARRVVQSSFAPLQTVAAPTNFAVDLRR